MRVLVLDEPRGYKASGVLGGVGYPSVHPQDIRCIMVRASAYLGFLGFLAATTSTFAKEVEVDAVRAAELYDSGVIHEQIMDTKKVCTDTLFL